MSPPALVKQRRGSLCGGLSDGADEYCLASTWVPVRTVNDLVVLSRKGRPLLLYISVLPPVSLVTQFPLVVVVGSTWDSK